MDERARVLEQVADHCAASRAGHPVRVGVDGITAAGKSTFARELVETLVAGGVPAVHLTLDDFHHVRERRHRRGRTSARGYYEDAYDVEAFAALVLEPLGPAGDRRIRTRLHDLETDEVLREPPTVVADDVAVVVDGSFLQREVLAPLWDLVVFLDVAPEIARERGAERDAAMFGGPDAARAMYDTRYLAAFDLYRDAIGPRGRAAVVIRNDDVRRPCLIREPQRDRS